MEKATKIKLPEFTPEWMEHRRRVRAIHLQLLKTVSGILGTFECSNGAKEGAATTEVKMGTTVLFKASGKDMMFTLKTGALFLPLADPLSRLIDLLKDHPIAVNDVDVKQEAAATKELRYEVYMGLIKQVLDLLLDFKMHRKIHPTDGILQQYKFGDQVLFEIKGKEYELDDNSAELFRPLRDPLLELLRLGMQEEGITQYVVATEATSSIEEPAADAVKAA